jgi:hypothetical protein
MDFQCLSGTFAWCMNLLRQPHPALKFVILNALAVSVACTHIACHVIGIHFAHVSLTKWKTAASTSGYLPFFGPVKLLMVA